MSTDAATPARTYSISGLKLRVLKLTFFDKNDGEKWSRILQIDSPCLISHDKYV